MQKVNLQTMNIQELKVLAYDIMMSIQNDQNALNQVNQQIAILQTEENAKKEPNGDK